MQMTWDAMHNVRCMRDGTNVHVTGPYVMGQCLVDNVHHVIVPLLTCFLSLPFGYLFIYLFIFFLFFLSCFSFSFLLLFFLAFFIYIIIIIFNHRSSLILVRV